MRKIYLIAGMWVALFSAKAQQVATFEEIDLQPDSFYNGSDGAGGFYSDGIWFPNNYNADWGSWSGFSVSNMQDTITSGYENQYSAVSGGGAENSENYAVVYYSGDLKIELNAPAEVEGFYVTNSVYAYQAILNGGDWTKKFGGNDGSDPDYFLLSIFGVDASGNVTDTVDFYLADYRYADPDEDYIVDDWVWLDLSALGTIKELVFEMYSTDVGEWGINTPTYFCIDNFTVSDINTNADKIYSDKTEVEVFPNPVTDVFQVVLNNDAESLAITDGAGRIIYRSLVKGQSHHSIDVLKNMSTGVYFLRINSESGITSKKIMKL